MTGPTPPAAPGRMVNVVVGRTCANAGRVVEGVGGGTFGGVVDEGSDGTTVDGGTVPGCGATPEVDLTELGVCEPSRKRSECPAPHDPVTTTTNPAADIASRDRAVFTSRTSSSWLSAPADAAIKGAECPSPPSVPARSSAGVRRIPALAVEEVPAAARVLPHRLYLIRLAAGVQLSGAAGTAAVLN
jgi:hypothetical protein